MASKRIQLITRDLKIILFRFLYCLLISRPAQNQKGYAGVFPSHTNKVKLLGFRLAAHWVSWQ